MQISDLLNQYQNNLASGSEISTGTKGIEQLVETAKQLKSGNIFEGTVNSIKGSQVILGLSSGQNITARLDKGVVLQKGQSVFFQVKSNDGAQVQIKPISMGGNMGNPTLMQALDAANLPANEKNLNMVNTMMREQMSIDAKSIQDMARQVVTTGAQDASTVVEMTKLGIPLTESNVQQFQNYKMDAGEVLDQISKIVDDIPNAISHEDINVTEGIALNRQIVSFFTGEDLQPQMEEQNISQSKDAGVSFVGENIEKVLDSPKSEVAEAKIIEENVGTMTKAGETNSVETQSSSLSANYQPSFVPEEGMSNQMITNKVSDFSLVLQDRDDYPVNTLGNVLPQKEYEGLQKTISQFPEFVRENKELFTTDAQLKPEVQTKELMIKLSDFLQKYEGQISKEDLHTLVKNKGYKNLLSNIISEQWTMKPEELKKEHSVRDLYERMEGQIKELQEIVSKAPKAGETVANAAKNLSQNIDFMNQINQTYTYIQVPLRLQGQNVNSELYVYRNNKEQKGEDEPLTAFLHFDMEHLGGMDISVKLLHKNVETNWYLESEDALNILSDNIQLLEKRLEDKGYSCSMSFNSNAKPMNFVEDFLKADAKKGGQLHRYSFDVRA